MIGALDNGVMGLMAHQMRMNVISHDIANVNTVGYKHSNVSFQEAFVQSLRSPIGGLPGLQSGMGVQMSQVSRSFTNGSFSHSMEPSHMAIFGNGFFVVGQGAERFLTRAGDFQLEAAPGGEAYLITPNGMRLHGVMGAGDLPGDMNGLAPINLREGLGDGDIVSAFSVGMDGTVRRMVNGGEGGDDGGVWQVVGRVGLAVVENPSGLEALGANLYRQTDAAMVRGVAGPGDQGVGQINQGYLENSNVDLAREFTDMIVTQRGFQANSRSITTADEMLNEVLALKR